MSVNQLEVSVNETEESQFRAQGFTQINVDLNKGARGKYIYLWYKTGCGVPITRIQFSFTEDMTKGLITAGYIKIDKDLNAGTRSDSADSIYLWYYKGCSEYDIPITELQVTTEIEDEVQLFRNGWERLACDLNRRCGGKWIYLFVKRETQTYICDITVSSAFVEDDDLLNSGHIRMDEDTNRDAKGSWIFIWYRQTTKNQNALRDLQISTTDDEYTSYQSQGYQVVNQNLNQGTTGSPVYLWSSKEICKGNPIKAITVILQPTAQKHYEEAGATVIPKNLNTGNSGACEFVCFNK